MPKQSTPEYQQIFREHFTGLMNEAPLEVQQEWHRLNFQIEYMPLTNYTPMVNVNITEAFPAEMKGRYHRLLEEYKLGTLNSPFN